MIKLTNISKSYHNPEKIQILENINLEVKKGDVCSIMGKSGSGKSTLLSLFAGLDVPSAGEITFHQKNYRSMNEAQMTDFRGKHIGIVFQSFYLMPHLTALENCMLPLEIFGIDGAKDRAFEMLKAVELDHRASHFPSQMSGGEQQRVAIARAIIHNPKLLLADEPSGNLDEKTGLLVMDLLFKVCEQHETALILVTHNKELGDRCSLKYILSDKNLERV